MSTPSTSPFAFIREHMVALGLLALLILSVWLGPQLARGFGLFEDKAHVHIAVDAHATDVVAVEVEQAVEEAVEAALAAAFEAEHVEAEVAAALEAVRQELSGLEHEIAGLDIDDLVAMRQHDVTPAFIAAIAEAGFDNLDVDDLVAMKIHGVTPAFIESMAEAGFDDLDVDDLVAMKIHGVTPEYAELMNGLFDK